MLYCQTCNRTLEDNSEDQNIIEKCDSCKYHITVAVDKLYAAMRCAGLAEETAKGIIKIAQIN